MSKVYIITMGEYSDKEILGIFSSKAEAENQLNLMSRYNRNFYSELNDHIEEYTLGEIVKPDNNDWRVKYEFQYDSLDLIGSMFLKGWGNDKVYFDGRERWITVYVIVKGDPEKELKIAADKAAKLKYEHEKGIPSE